MFKKLIAKLKCYPKFKLIGSVMIAAGILLLICFLPGWAWGAILGFALIGSGIYMISV